MRKNYGQNFLVNPAARERLLDALEAPPGGGIWEPGPGLGAMTRGLLERGGRVCAFEIDPGFIAALKDFFGGDPAFTLVEGDVMKTWPGTAHAGDYLLGNLPYTIGAALLADFIEKKRFFRRMVVTLQKETARRMLARPGQADYSSFSALCASSYLIRPLLSLKGASFFPEPRVESQALRLDLREDGIFLNGTAPACLPALIRALFASRRKTVKNNLRRFVASSLGKPGGAEEASDAALARAGVSPEERAERLGLEELTAIAASLESVLPRDGGTP